MKRFDFWGNNKGFTLIELTVVIIIIGVLSAVVIPQFTKQADKARVKRAIAEIRSMKAAIDAYYVEAGSFPEADNADSIADVMADSGIKWASMKDPWKNGYIYTLNENEDGDEDKYRIISPGPSGAIYDDTNDDIYASETKEVMDGQKIDAFNESFESGEE